MDSSTGAAAPGRSGTGCLERLGQPQPHYGTAMAAGASEPCSHLTVLGRLWASGVPVTTEGEFLLQRGAYRLLLQPLPSRDAPLRQHSTSSPSPFPSSAPPHRRRAHVAKRSRSLHARPSGPHTAKSRPASIPTRPAAAGPPTPRRLQELGDIPSPRTPAAGQALPSHRAPCREGHAQLPHSQTHTTGDSDRMRSLAWLIALALDQPQKQQKKQGHQGNCTGKIQARKQISLLLLLHG
eukprot:GHVT01016882.1.p1 GENE.GHVT01016882.1~~GHVT01016882.1.p1  ORF type:complete len:238 (-),score=36.64 GHVT01016882.1:256-969(-)